MDYSEMYQADRNTSLSEDDYCAELSRFERTFRWDHIEFWYKNWLIDKSYEGDFLDFFNALWDTIGWGNSDWDTLETVFSFYRSDSAFRDDYNASSGFPYYYDKVHDMLQNHHGNGWLGISQDYATWVKSGQDESFIYFDPS